MKTDKVSQLETPYTTKQRRNRIWLTRFTMLIGFGFLVYIGYCWGLWGRHSLLLQYLFQCSCPAASTEARYPEEVDVIIPACRYVGSMLSPSGRLLYVQEKNGSSNSTYLLELKTDEKTPLFFPEGNNYFLTDDLLFLSLEYGHVDYEGGEYILDRTTGKQYSIQSFVFWHSDAYINRDLNQSLLAKGLQEADDVFLIGNNTIVAIASNFPLFPEHSFYIDQAAFPGRGKNRAELFLKQNDIDYKFVPERYPGETLSPDGRFIARADGIYLTTTGQKIVDEYSSSKYYRWYRWGYYSVRGWTDDSTAVIYSTFLVPCLVEVPLLGVDEVGCFIRVPQPVLKLKVPEEYLLPP